MLWNEATKNQGCRWIDVLPAFIIAYNQTTHSAHKKSPYEAFFGFKMNGVYATPGETAHEVDESGETSQAAAQATQVDESDETVQAAAQATQVDESGETSQAAAQATQVDESDETVQAAAQATQVETDDTEVYVIIEQEDGTFGEEAQEEEEGIPAAYEAHVTRVEGLRQGIAQNDEQYRNKMVIRGSVHQKKLTFKPGDKVAIASDHDTNQKTRKRKLEQFCSGSGEVVGMCNDNRTVRIRINGEVKTFPAKNVRKLK
jgi:hypothetical protein